MVKKAFNSAGDEAAQQGATVSHVDLSFNIWTILCCGGLMDVLRYLTISLTLIKPQCLCTMPNVSWGKEVEQLLLTSEEHFKTGVGLGRREASLETAKGR